MKKLLPALALLGALGSAHASDNLVDTEKHALPSHQLSWSDTLDVIVDTRNQNVCYVARQSDSHAMQMQCLPLRK
jgi:hypothetical protein